MNSRERVLTALSGGEPDRVPYCELGIDRALAAQLMGWSESLTQTANLEQNPYTVDEAAAIAAELSLDNICCVLRAPVFAQKVPGTDGRLFYGEGLIRSRADLDRFQLPDPYDEALYEEAESYIRGRGDYATWFVTRAGIFPTILSLGIESFGVGLYEDREFVETVLDAYTDWSIVVAQRACELGFDAYVTTDDMAFKSAPFFSPHVFRELVLPRYERLAESVTIPWVIHSDGNILPFLDDLLSLGIVGLHPVEEGAMDIRAMKRDYGHRLCLLGNVDLNILGMGTPADVEAIVRDLIRDVAPGGGYIVTSGNSLAGYLLPENARALAKAVQRYGQYPIRI